MNYFKEKYLIGPFCCIYFFFKHFALTTILYKNIAKFTVQIFWPLLDIVLSMVISIVLKIRITKVCINIFYTNSTQVQFRRQGCFFRAKKWYLKSNILILLKVFNFTLKSLCFIYYIFMVY